jgi:hypothetical protein
VGSILTSQLIGIPFIKNLNVIIPINIYSAEYIPPTIRALVFITPYSIPAPAMVLNHFVKSEITLRPLAFISGSTVPLHRVIYTTIIKPVSIHTLQQIGLPTIVVNMRIRPRAILTKQWIPLHKIKVPTSPGFISGYFDQPMKIKNDIEIYMMGSYGKIGD